MNLCNHNHEEVCYESNDCPACAYKDEVKDLELTIKNLEKEIEQMESTINDLSP